MGIRYNKLFVCCSNEKDMLMDSHTHNLEEENHFYKANSDRPKCTNKESNRDLVRFQSGYNNCFDLLQIHKLYLSEPSIYYNISLIKEINNYRKNPIEGKLQLESLKYKIKSNFIHGEKLFYLDFKEKGIFYLNDAFKAIDTAIETVSETETLTELQYDQELSIMLPNNYENCVDMYYITKILKNNSVLQNRKYYGISIITNVMNPKDSATIQLINQMYYNTTLSRLNEEQDTILNPLYSKIAVTHKKYKKDFFCVYIVYSS